MRFQQRSWPIVVVGLFIVVVVFVVVVIVFVIVVVGCQMLV